MGRMETLAAVREKYPQYGDMSDDQLGAALASKYPEYADLAAPAEKYGPPSPPAPGLTDTIREGYQTLRGGVTKALNLLDMPGTRAALQEPPPGEVYNPLPRDLSSGLAQTALGAFVPGRPGGTPWVTAKPGLRGAAERVGATAGGAATGAVAEGDNTALEVVREAGPVALLEAVVPGLSKLVRSTGWGQRATAADDAAKYAREMGRQSPTLATGAKSAEDLQRLAGGQGQQLLSSSKARVNDEINARAGLIEVPSIARTTTVPGHRTATAPPPMDPEIQAVTRGTTTSVPGHTVREPMTFQEANDALSAIGARAFSKNPLDRNFNGVDQRKLYGQVRNEIKAGLDARDPTGKLSAMFEQAQADFARGLAFLRPLQKKGAFRTGDALEFNTPAFQRMLADPKAEASLRNKLGDEGFEALRTAMLRGGKVGEVDQMAGKAPGLLSGRGSYGMWRVPAELGRAIFPNASTKYAGRPPYSLPPELQAILDVGLQKMGGAALDARTR